ncbi:MAG TPA: septal ring lytic transglycosylase RlpA family protein, partial [Thermoanaerobaculia bacterium]|nr:septal ring lytic transglycosylase RlpA family protein [Thermoanaerobaculia bacterium]
AAAAIAAAAIIGAAACASKKPPRPAARPAPPPVAPPNWSEEGVASWYGGGDGFDGKPTASGEIFDSSKLTAAHRELPLGSIVDVTSLDSNRTVRVRINDRGPFAHGRVIDLSQAAAREIAMLGPGTARVHLVLVTEGVVIEPTSSNGLWAVQVGSFAERPRADRHAARVRSAGYTVYFESFKGLTRVKVGPLDSRADAEAALAALEQAGFEGIVVAANK